MHITKNMYPAEVRKLYSEHFAKLCILAEINTKNHYFHVVFMIFTMKIGLSTILTIIFVISAMKYVNMGSSKEIVEFTYSELHP